MHLAIWLFEYKVFEDHYIYIYISVANLAPMIFLSFSDNCISAAALCVTVHLSPSQRVNLQNTISCHLDAERQSWSCKTNFEKSESETNMKFLWRYVLAWMGCLGIMNVYFCRINLSVAMVAMVGVEEVEGTNFTEDSSTCTSR